MIQLQSSRRVKAISSPSTTANNTINLKENRIATTKAQGLCLEESSTKAQLKDSIKDNNPKNMQRSQASDNESDYSSPSSLYPVASLDWSPPSSPASPHPPFSSPLISPNYSNIHSLVNTPVCLSPFLVVSGSTTNQPLATIKLTTPAETKVIESQKPSFSSVARAVNIQTPMVDSQLRSPYKNLYRCDLMIIEMSGYRDNKDTNLPND